MSPNFIHLQCHSEYSLVDGLLRMKPLVVQTAAFNMPAVAITDQCNLFGMVKFYKEALAAGIKPIIGCDVWIENELNQSLPTKITLLCQNYTGYTNLTSLISKGYIEGQHNGKPILKKTWLSAANAGLIALAHSRESDIACCLQTEDKKFARILINYWQAIFPDRFYLCVTRINRKGEAEYIKQIVEIAESTACPLVATNEVCFLKSDDFEAHEARVCINAGLTLNDSTRQRNYSEEQYLKSPEEMAALFADLPAALENTVEIAKRCNLILSLNKVFLPKYPVPSGCTTEQTLHDAAVLGLETRFPRILKNCNDEQIAAKQAQYRQRLQREIEVINKMGFAGYFLIVADFIRWAHKNNIPVGPGRGSGAGSIVAYALEITAVDPLQYDLLFERFLNPERVSLPDFDIDFCMEGRDRVIEYVHNKYGKEAVSQIITFGTMAAKAVIRDVGRVLGYPYGFVDQIAKLIPFELGMTLDKALEQEELLNTRYKKEDDVKLLIDLAKKLEGVTRNVGTHAGGVVIAPSKLTDYTPLYCEEGATAQPITQFDKYDVETIGLIKFDFLGLRTLTIIDWALQTINAQRKTHGIPIIDLYEIPLNDPKPFALLNDCNTTGVFQLESRGMRDLMRRLQPDCFEDIVALVALFRPGPLQSGMVDDFINRKKGLADIKYLHPKLEPILQATYGVILYQEQVMRVAQELAGYTLGAADVLRSAMGKKKPKEMAKQRKIFIKGATDNGIAEDIAENIFNLMEKFAGYGFNKSHSVAYALIAYQTAWLKAHFPAAFMAAVLSADMSNTDKVVIFIQDCKELGLKIISPDINRSCYKFLATIDNEIIYGLGAIKGIGEAAIATIIEARENGGAFRDLFDFCSRIDLRKASKRVIEALIGAGALDGLGLHRAAIMANLECAIHAALQIHKNLSFGQEDLFGSHVVAADLNIEEQFNDVPHWSEQERLSREKAVLGLYLTGHPIDAYAAELQKIGISRITELRPTANKQYKIAGFITAFKTRFTKKGERMAFITLDDKYGHQELMIFSDLLQKHLAILKPDNFIIVEGSVSEDTYSGGCRFGVKEITTLEKIRANLARSIEIIVNADVPNNFITALHKILHSHQSGTCPIIIKYKINNAEAKIRLGREWMFSPSVELIRDITALGDGITAAVNYLE